MNPQNASKCYIFTKPCCPFCCDVVFSSFWIADLFFGTHDLVCLNPGFSGRWAWNFGPGQLTADACPDVLHSCDQRFKPNAVSAWFSCFCNAAEPIWMTTWFYGDLWMVSLKILQLVLWCSHCTNKLSTRLAKFKPFSPGSKTELGTAPQFIPDFIKMLPIL